MGIHHYRSHGFEVPGRSPWHHPLCPLVVVRFQLLHLLSPLSAASDQQFPCGSPLPIVAPEALRLLQSATCWLLWWFVSVGCTDAHRSQHPRAVCRLPWQSFGCTIPRADHSSAMSQSTLSPAIAQVPSFRVHRWSGSYVVHGERHLRDGHFVYHRQAQHGQALDH